MKILSAYYERFIDSFGLTKSHYHRTNKHKKKKKKTKFVQLTLL